MVIHHVFANKSNIGDWLSAQGIQKLLGQPVVEHFCDEPFVADTLGRLAACAEEDLVVIGGGGLFRDYFEPFWRGLLPLAPRLRCYIWGVGYCDLKREQTKPAAGLIEAVVATSRLCIVRDELTRQHLSGCALPEAVACPSVAVLQRGDADGRGILHVDNYLVAGADVFEAMDRCGQAFAKATDRVYRRTNNRLDPVTTAGLDGLLQRYAQSDVVLSSALHGCIIGVALGKKVLAVSGDRKIEAFMRAAGLGRWVLGIDQVDRLPAKLHTLDEQGDAQAFLETARAANRRTAQRVLSAAD